MNKERQKFLLPPAIGTILYAIGRTADLASTAYVLSSGKVHEAYPFIGPFSTPEVLANSGFAGLIVQDCLLVTAAATGSILLESLQRRGFFGQKLENAPFPLRLGFIGSGLGGVGALGVAVHNLLLLH